MAVHFSKAWCPASWWSITWKGCARNFSQKLTQKKKRELRCEDCTHDIVRLPHKVSVSLCSFLWRVPRATLSIYCGCNTFPFATILKRYKTKRFNLKTWGRTNHWSLDASWGNEASMIAETSTYTPCALAFQSGWIMLIQHERQPICYSYHCMLVCFWYSLTLLFYCLSLLPYPAFLNIDTQVTNLPLGKCCHQISPSTFRLRTCWSY